MPHYCRYVHFLDTSKLSSFSHEFGLGCPFRARHCSRHWRDSRQTQPKSPTLRKSPSSEHFPVLSVLWQPCDSETAGHSGSLHVHPAQPSGDFSKAPCAGIQWELLTRHLPAPSPLTSPSCLRRSPCSSGTGLLSIIGGRQAELARRWAGHHPRLCCEGHHSSASRPAPSLWKASTCAASETATHHNLCSR